MSEYVVIGAGAAGCVLTRRLVDAGKSVCLIEAGELMDYSSNVDDVGGFTNLWGSRFDWVLPTTQQPGMGGRQILINQGRIVGGSSAINAMMYVRGNLADYSLISDRTDQSWSTGDVESAFSRIENYHDSAAPGRYRSGLMSVRNCPDTASYSPEFQQAAIELGYKGNDFDYNGPSQGNGAGPLQFNIGLDGRRHSAFNAYLQPILGSPLLTLLTRTEVVKIVLNGTRAAAIEAIESIKGPMTISFDKEVIVCCGALQTPALLLRSGIGPADQLSAAGIEVVADLAAVGQNLSDHLQLPVIYRLTKPLPEPTLLTGNVLFTSVNNQGIDGSPDLQLNFTPAAPKPLQRILPPLGGPVMIFLPILVQPRSQGTVSIAANGSIVIDPNYLGDSGDTTVLKNALELVRSMARTKALSSLAGEELGPGNVDPEAYIRGAASTLWHPVGTCAIGTGQEDSVVDADLRVHGLEGLRVCDASVIPRATTGNSHVPTLVVSEIGAERIIRGDA